MKIAQLKLPGITVEDPLQGGSEAERFGNVGSIVSAILPYVLVLGGLVLFGMLLIGGFELLTATGNEEKMAAGAARIKNALIGFLLLFAVYWMAQILQVLFKIPIL